MDWWSYINLSNTSDHDYFLLDSDKVWNIEIPIYKDPFIKDFAIYTDTNTFYNKNLNSCFSIEFVLQGLNYNIYHIEFKHKYDLQRGNDLGTVEISYDRGENWNNIFSDSIFMAEGHYLENFYDSNDSSIFFNDIGFTGIKSKYEWSSINLLPYNSNLNKWSVLNDTAKIRFCIKSDSVNSNNVGWIISDFFLGWTILHSTQEQKSKSNQFKVINLNHNRYRIASQSMISKIELIDINGRALNTFMDAEIDLSNYSKGLYFLRINGIKPKK